MDQKQFFNRYSIDVKRDRIGGGAFGTVYKAYDNLSDQWKAIKVEFCIHPAPGRLVQLSG